MAKLIYSAIMPLDGYIADEPGNKIVYSRTLQDGFTPLTRVERAFEQGVTTHRYAIRDVSEASPC